MRIFPWLMGLTLAGCFEESDKPEQNDSIDTNTDTDTDTDTTFLHANGITVLCPNASVGDTGVVNEITYTKRDRTVLMTL